MRKSNLMFGNLSWKSAKDKIFPSSSIKCFTLVTQFSDKCLSCKVFCLLQYENYSVYALIKTVKYFGWHDYDHFWKIVMTDVGHSVIFGSKVLDAKNRLQSCEQAGCWHHSLDLSVALREQCWFLPPKMHLTFYKEICATFRFAVIKDVRHNTE